MKFICWDIDGTLLLTERAGYDALVQAIKARFNQDSYQFPHTLAGCTDSQIIKEIVTDIKGRCSSADAAGLLITYHMLLRNNLKSHQGRLMPNVVKVLDYLATLPQDFTSCLLTGNTGEGAKAKVVHYGIDKYFDFAHSAFGDLSENRDELAKILYSRLLAQGLVNSPKDLIIIGDTPNDVKCAGAIKARCMIVLSGSEYTREDFELFHPWRVIDELPADPEAFVKLLEED